MKRARRKRLTLFATGVDRRGVLHEFASSSLRGLASSVRRSGYDGGTLKVVDEPGFTRGWVHPDGSYRSS